MKPWGTPWGTPNENGMSRGERRKRIIYNLLRFVMNKQISERNKMRKIAFEFEKQIMTDDIENLCEIQGNDGSKAIVEITKHDVGDLKQFRRYVMRSTKTRLTGRRNIKI